MVPPNLPINNKFSARSSCTKLVQNMFMTHIELLAQVVISFKVSVSKFQGQVSAEQCGRSSVVYY